MNQKACSWTVSLYIFWITFNYTVFRVSKQMKNNFVESNVANVFKTTGL